MRRCIIVISGFTEKMYEDTGSRQLWEKLVQFEEHNGHDDIVFVEFKEWDANWKHFGKWLTSLNVSECFVCSYSWGSGHGLKEFAKAFSGAISCVLCDPVYHSRTILGRWMALFDRTIKYPSNVRVLKWFYQTLDEPGGDKVKGAPKGIRLNAPHRQIDNHPAYHEAAIWEIKQWLADSNQSKESK